MDALSPRHVRAGGCPARQVVLACFGVGVVLRARRDRAVDGGGGTKFPLLLASSSYARRVIRAARAYATRRDVTCRAVTMSAVTAIRDRTAHQTTEDDVRRSRLGLSGGRPPRMKPSSQPASCCVTRDDSRRRHVQGGHDVAIEIVIATARRRALWCVLTARRRPPWRRREMQRGWRGSSGCGVAAAVGGVCCGVSCLVAVGSFHPSSL